MNHQNYSSLVTGKRMLSLISFVFFSFYLTTAYAQSTVIINSGTAGTPAYNAGPIYRSVAGSAYDASRYCYLYTQGELATAGITAGSTISVVGWVKSNGSVTTGPAIFRIYMKNSSASSFSLATVPWTTLNSGTTLVYENLLQDIPSDSFPNFISFPLTVPFIYTGGSLEISTEWDINSVSGNPTTGTFSWMWSTVTDRIYGDGETSLANASTLSSTSNSISAIDDRRPFIQITYGPTEVVAFSKTTSLSVFPNPAADKIRIEIYTSIHDDLQIKLVTLAGQTAFNTELINFSGHYQKELDVEDFAKGIYFLYVQTKNNVTTKKIVIE